MAVGGGEKRAEAMSALAGMYHRQATAPEIADWIAAAEKRSAERRAAGGRLREFQPAIHQHDLPAGRNSSSARRRARMRSEQLWRDLRAKNDWAGFLPALEGVVALVREEAALRADVLGLDPYDALMEQYDPGNRAADITPVFAELKTFLQGLRSRGAGRAGGAAGASAAEAALRQLSDRQAARARPRHDGARSASTSRMAALSVSHHPVLRRRADRRAHHHPLQDLGFPVGADGRAARDRPRALRAEPAEGVGALAARQGARHGGARKPEPVRRKAARPQPGLLALGAAGGRKASRRNAGRSTTSCRMCTRSSAA